MKKTLLSILFSGAALAPGYSAVIASWNLTGNSGSETTVLGTTALPEISAVAPLSRGPGLTVPTINPISNTFTASGWDTAAAALPANDNDYIQFGFTVASGSTIDLSNLVIATRSVFDGPGTIGLYYSGDSYATSLHSFVQSAGSTDYNWTVDLTSLPDLTTGTVTFRLIQIGNTRPGGSSTPRAAGNFYVLENSGSNVAFNGTVVPEPSTALLGGLGILALLRRRRH